jgi:hypothetical protein
MRYDSCQFGSFDGLDNRRELMVLFERLGDPLPEALKREKRAEFLRKMIRLSGNGFADKKATVRPCDAVEAYFQFVAITGCLQVDINRAAKMLEDELRF